VGTGIELSLRRFPAAPERGGADEVELFTDSEVVSGLEDGSVEGWLAANGLCEAHPDTTERPETTKTIKSANLKKPFSSLGHRAGGIRELYCWSNCCRGIAAFTGGP
jgi:hypothetical protein